MKLEKYSSKDHTRVCGKNSSESGRMRVELGSPPRVREKRPCPTRRVWNVRITPACAGKTCRFCSCTRCQGDHPRVCGKNIPKNIQDGVNTGSPPRVREKLFSRKGQPSQPKDHPRMCGKNRNYTNFERYKTGSPPHVREKLKYRLTYLSRNWDHPRMCGKNSALQRFEHGLSGSPPHVREKLFHYPATKLVNGITPACAGKTP